MTLENIPYAAMSRFELYLQVQALMKQDPDKDTILVPVDLYWALVYQYMQDNDIPPTGFVLQGKRVEMDKDQ